MTLSKDQGALKPCICADPENCVEPIPGRICKRERPPLAAEPVGQTSDERWRAMLADFEHCVRYSDRNPTDGYAKDEVMIARRVVLDALNSLPTLQSDLAQAQRQIKEWECSLSDYREKWNLVALENQKLAAERDKLQADLTEAREALGKINRIPSMPFPDAGAHSWRAFGESVFRAYCEIRRISGAAQVSSTSPDDAVPKLLAALQSIAKSTCCETCQEAALVANAALDAFAKAKGAV